MKETEVRCRWMRAIDLVTSVTSIDLSGRLELRCFATRVAFVRELQNHGHAYRFPGNPADAYYLPDDSVVLIGTYVSPVNWVIEVERLRKPRFSGTSVSEFPEKSERSEEGLPRG